MKSERRKFEFERALTFVVLFAILASVSIGIASASSPKITSYLPATPISDTEGATRTFSIETNQTVNVSWQINGTEIQTNGSETTASYTNASAKAGTWNVSAIATNENGTAMHTWIWRVSPPEVIEIHGDLIISEAKTYSDVKIILTGNLEVKSGGDLTLSNVTLFMNSSSDGEYEINVESGGTLKLINGSLIRSLDPIGPKRYKFNVHGTLIMKGSTVSYLYDPIKIYSLYDGLIRFNLVLIDNSSILQSRTDGIYLEHTDQTKEFTDIKIINSTIAHNGGDGIELKRSNALIINNTITSNTKNGIYMEYSGPTIENNNIFSNSDQGIYCYRYSHPTIKANTILSNSDYGIYLKDHSNPKISDCTVSGNGERGIYCNDRCYPKIENCTVTSHTYNIYSYRYSHPTIRDSTITPSGTNDVRLESRGRATLINVTFDKSKVRCSGTTEILRVKWYLDVKVVDANGSVVPDAIVKVYRDRRYNPDSLAFEGTTDENGTVRGIVLKEYEQSSSGKNYFTPHIVTVSNATCLNYSLVKVDKTKEAAVVLAGYNDPTLLYGDINIDTTVVWKDETRTIRGDLNIFDGGELVLDNVTLSFDIKRDGMCGISVASEGTMKLINDSVIASPADKRYMFNVYGTLIIKDSTVSYLYNPIKIYSVYDGIIRFNRVLIENSSVAYSRADGIYIEHTDQTKAFTDIKIVNSTIAHNKGNGIKLMRSNAFIINNTIMSNTKNGIYMEYSSPTIEGNNIMSSSGDGIDCNKYSHPTVRANSILSNRDYGIYLRDHSNPKISDCTVSGNRERGIYCDHYSYPKIENCTVTSHTYNIYSYYHSHPTIKDSTITPSGTNDVRLESRGRATLINVTFDKSKVRCSGTTEILTVKWNLDVKVVDANGNMVPDANVKVYRDRRYNPDSLAFEGTTDENGTVRGIVLKEYTQTSAGKNYFTPHIVTVSNATCLNYSLINVDKTKEVTVVLAGYNYPTEIYGDINIATAVIWKDETKTIRGNLNILNGGELVLDNVTLSFDLFRDGLCGIDIQEGSTLKLINGSVIRSPPEKRYKFNVHGTLIMKGSTVSYLYNPIKIYSIYDDIIRFNRVLIENSSIIYSRTGGIYMEHSDETKQFTDIKIVNSTIAHSGGDGIHLTNSNALIINSTIAHNTGDGIDLRSSNAFIINNTITSNTKNGIYMEYSSPTIEGNNIMSSSDDGIDCNKYSHPTLKANTIRSNSHYGIYLRDHSNPKINDCTVSGNGERGIYCFDYSHPKIENCTVTSHKYNIYSYRYSHPTIRDSTITPSGTKDVRLESRGRATLINTTFDKSKVQCSGTTEILRVKWYLDVKVVDRDGDKVPFANIAIKDKSDNEVVNTTADRRGMLYTQLVEYTQNSAGKTMKTPHNVTAIYKTYNKTELVTLDSHKTVTVALDFNYVKGDADGDGNVTSNDAQMALAMAVDKIPVDYIVDVNGPGYNGDGRVTAVDALIILKASVGLIELT